MSFDTLPTEIAASVVKNITRPTDLKNVCLASKGLYAVAVTFLYRNFILKLDRYMDVLAPDRLQLIHGDNVGLRYIRTVTMTLDNSHFLQSLNGCRKTIRAFLDLLPENKLEEFKISGEVVIDVETTLHLHSMQKNLKVLRLGPLADSVSDMLTQRLECLIIPPILGSFDDLTLYGSLLESCRNLKHLAVHCRSNIDLSEDRSRFNDGRTYDSRIVKRLFGHLTRSYNNPPLKLERLELSHILLKYGNRTYLQIVDFAGLTSLTLSNCPWSTEFLRHLNQQFRIRSPALKHLRYEAETVHSAVIAEFLGSLTGLVTLHVSVESLSMDYRDVLVDAVQLHALTLQDLLLRRSWKVIQNKIQSFSTQMVKLRQLGVALPEISTQDAELGEWGEYGDAIAAIAAAPRLTLLRLLSWPNPPAHEFEGLMTVPSPVDDEDDDYDYNFAFDIDVKVAPITNRIFATIMDDFATNLMRYIESRVPGKPCPTLVFGTRDRNDPVDSTGVRRKVKPTAYIPGKQMDKFGQVHRVAIRTEPRLLKYVDPEMDEVATKWLDDRAEAA